MQIQKFKNRFDGQTIEGVLIDDISFGKICHTLRKFDIIDRIIIYNMINDQYSIIVAGSREVPEPIYKDCIMTGEGKILSSDIWIRQ